MKILFYSALPTARHGGVVGWMQQMVSTLRSLGHRVHVVAWGTDPGRIGPAERERWGTDFHFARVDARLLSLPLLRFWGPLLAASRAGRRLIEQEGIEIVQCVGVYEAYSALRACRAGGAAVVLSVHGDFVTEMAGRRNSRMRRSLYLPVERYALRHCEAVTTSSRWLRDRLNNLAPQIGTTRAAVIPNGIALPPQEGACPDRRMLDLPVDRPVVLTVNNLYAPYRRRGLELLAAAAPAIVERVPDVLFVVAGGVNDPARDAASLRWAQERTHGLPFRFTGYRPRSPADLMAAADLYLHSSALDNSPTAVLEAMALGRPVVATAVGGIPELITHGETGLLAPFEAAPLASAVVRLLLDRPLADSLGRQARERAQSEFTWVRAGERFAELYEQVARPRAAQEGRAR